MITIIILLILATITISTLRNSNLMKKSASAKSKTINAEIEEKIKTDIMSIQIDSKNVEKGVTLKTLHDELPIVDKKITTNDYEEGSNTLDGVYKYRDKDNYEFTIDEKFNVKVVQSNIVFGEVKWAKGKASIEISTKKNEIIEYQVNSIDGTWTKGTAAGASVTVENLNNKDKVYARLEGSAEIQDKTILDEIAPTGSIAIDKTTAKPGETITATVTATDNESGVTLTNCKWIMNTSNEQLGTDETKYTGGNLTSEGKASITASSEEGTYYVHALVKDNAENKIEVISQTINIDLVTYNYTTTGMVEYDAGKWTQEEINQLKSLNLYNINIERTIGTAAGLNFTFGGFTYKGDTANASNISNGIITTSRNKSITTSSGRSSTKSDGWIILEWGETSGTKKYVKKLISAGSPENFVFATGSDNRGAYRAEYVLSGGTRQTGYATYKPRSFDMYKDKNKTNMIEEVHCMTKDEANKIVSDNTKTTDNRIDVADYYYWLATIDNQWYLYSVANGNVAAYSIYLAGIRPVVTLKSGVYVDTSKHNGTGSDKYVLEMDQ